MNPIGFVLQNQLNSLSSLIQKELDKNKLKKIGYVLTSYSKYLKNYNLQLKVSINSIQRTCMVCDKPILERIKAEFYLLNCGHSVCSDECIIKAMIDSTGNNIEEYEYTFCKCGSLVNKEFIIKAFGGIDQINLIMNELANQRAPLFECKMCYNQIRIDQGKTLDCNHRFCQKCLEDYLKIPLLDGNPDPERLKCPQCSSNISINITKSILPSEDFKKYDYALFDIYKPEILKNEIYFKCINEGCSFAAIVPNNLKKIKFKTCLKNYCTVCRDFYHPNITCEQKHDSNQDESLLILAKQEGWKTCPHCKTMCDKISGCNYMKCFSNVCNGKKSFCYLCGKAISLYSHFKAQGPFGLVCNTMDGNED